MAVCGGWRCVFLTLVFILLTVILVFVVSCLLAREGTYGGRDGRDPRSAQRPFPGRSPDNLFWFVQMTDIHISRYRGMPDRLAQFRAFLSQDMDVLKPEVLILTGDLTDAKDRSRQGSQQYEDEWKWYNAAIKDSNAENRTIILDIRGNHDAFNVPHLKHESNYFLKYGVSGRKHPRSYMHLHEKKFGSYAFVGVDACPDPGLKRPFNFFGYLDEEEWKRLDHLKADSRKANATIWFGHYPSSVVISANQRQLKTLVGDGLVYLCGHLHTLGGLAPKMHTIQKLGNLELELGDWLDNRLYRIVALDHDIMSFSDETYNRWPVVLVTNPAHSGYLLPDREPTARIKYSTHIRILVFSPDDIISVKVFLDGTYFGQAEKVSAQLFVIPWQPEDYPTSAPHSIKVHVIDNHGREKVVKQPFSIDLERTKALPLKFANFYMQADISSVLKLVFLSVWLVATLPLVSLHVYGRMLRGQYCGPLASFLRRWYHHFFVLCKSPGLFYPLLILNFYLACGPWFIGYVMDDHIGVAFTFGIYVMGQLLPMHTTLAYGTIQMVTFNIPLTICLAAMSDGIRNESSQTRKSRIKSVFNLEYSLFYSILVLQVLKVVSNYLSYGTLATVLSPLFLWQIIFAFALKRRAGIVRRQTGGQ